MGTGFVVGMDCIPLLELALLVGGPLAALQAERSPESVGLLYLIRETRNRFGHSEPILLLVFIDLVLLSVLLKRGTCEVYPDHSDIAHFNVILQLLTGSFHRDAEMERSHGPLKNQG